MRLYWYLVFQQQMPASTRAMPTRTYASAALASDSESDARICEVIGIQCPGPVPVAVDESDQYSAMVSCSVVRLLSLVCPSSGLMIALMVERVSSADLRLVRRKSR